MSSYYEGQLERVLPVDNYGLSVKFRSETGETKWMMITQESLPIFKNFLERLVLSSDPEDSSIRVKEPK